MTDGIRVCSLADLDDGKPFAVEVADPAGAEPIPVVLVRVGDRLHALRDECSHAEVALSEGELTGKGIECWFHGSCFNLATGAPASLPATEPVDVFAVTSFDGDVYVDVREPINRK
jgi:3-phenylpropionate/trans-cinnamate dioxygenase ferredoxin subunit